MTLPVLDRDETLLSLADSSRRWTELLRSVQDPSRIAVGHWTIRDAAVHTSQLFAMFPDLVTGGTSPITDHLTMAEAWDARVKAQTEHDLEAIVDRIERSTKEFTNRATQEVWEREVWWHGGLKTPVFSLAGILINEAEVHGWDVARAEGRAWDVAPDKATRAILGLLPVLPYFVDQEVAGSLDARYELRLRGGPRLYLTLIDGNLSIDTRPRPVDCHLSVDPVEYLMIGYGRRSQWWPIATGKVVAWGRRPMLALKFAKLFHSP